MCDPINYAALNSKDDKICTNNSQILDHRPEYFPIDPATGKKIHTLDNNGSSASVLYRYGIFGDLRFVDICEKLGSKKEYDDLIKKLENKINEIETWIGEYDDNEERDLEHKERIKCVMKFIDRIKSISNTSFG